jgi:two-component system, OmpR family, sensor histidine kinase CiaH
LKLLTRRRLSRVGIASTRVALAATAIVAVVYLVIAAGVLVILQRNLTSNIDDQLRGSLSRITDGPPPQSGGGFDAPHGGPPGGHPYGPPLIVWTVHPDGTVNCNDKSLVLPMAYRSVQGPQTASIGGATLRLDGQPVRSDYVIVGITLDSVEQARSTLIEAEAIVGPILLVAVSFGALTIGRRVAAPIEMVRQRQMEFTADASHELRTPLSVIEATTTLALSRERDNAWYRSAFERVHGESQRIRQLVEDLLWLARFDATGGQPDTAPVDLGVLARQTAERFKTLAEAGDLSISVQVTDDSAVVVAPAEWLDRLLGVLLDNACKYSNPGGAVDVTVRPEGSRVRLTVDDGGPGIPLEERPRIFDRFHRASERPGGAGLGLAIADAVVRATNGHWEIGSSAAGGASMSVTWPRTLAGSRNVGARRASPSSGTTVGRP